MRRTTDASSKGFRRFSPLNTSGSRPGAPLFANTTRDRQSGFFSGRGISLSRGFTLIEAMIVMLIVAIIVALAYPAYVDQIRKSRRADAEVALLESAQLLERCFTRLNTYTTGCPDPSGASENGYYVVDIVERTATTYTLRASAQGDQANDPCDVYTLDHLGNKTPLPSGDRCWGVGSS